MALTGSQVIDALSETTGFSKRDTRDFLAALSTLAEEELHEGESFTIPGIVKLDFRYTAAKKKGEQYKVVGTGEIKKREAGVPAKLRAKARPVARMHRAVPSVTSKAGKQVASRFKK